MKLRHANKSLIFSACGALLLIYLLFGCAGARNMQKTSESKKTTLNEAATHVDTTTTKKVAEKENNVQVNTNVAETETETTETTTRKPVDPKLPSSYTDDNGKKHDLTNTEETTTKTTKKKDKKDTSVTTQAQKEKVAETQEKGVSDAFNKQATEEANKAVKQTISFKLSLWWLLLLLIPAGVIWYFWRKKKKLPDINI